MAVDQLSEVEESHVPEVQRIAFCGKTIQVLSDVLLVPRKRFFVSDEFGIDFFCRRP